MKWIRPAIVKLNNLRAFPSLYRGYADTRILARNIPNPSTKTIFPGDLVVCENPWEKGKLLVRRVKSISQYGDNEESCLAWVSSETISGGIDSKAFGPIPIDTILGRACYFYNNDTNHGPIVNNQESIKLDREYISHVYLLNKHNNCDYSDSLVSMASGVSLFLIFFLIPLL